MVPALDLELIRTFMTVISEGDFKRAASKLNKTPAAISMQIKKLEELLGQRLLERNNKGTSLTSHGQLLKMKGEQLLNLNYEILGDMRSEELSGGITFGAPTDYTPALLQNLLPIFKREFPKVDPAIVLEPSRSLRKKVKSGEIDIAIVAREADTNEGIYLWVEEVNWYGTYQADGNAPMNIGLLSTDCVLRDRAMQSIQQSKLPHRICLQAASVDSLRVATEQGFCGAYLPKSVTKDIPNILSDFINTQLDLEFALIAGPTIDPSSLDMIARKLALELKG